MPTQTSASTAHSTPIGVDINARPSVKANFNVLFIATSNYASQQNMFL